MPTPPPSAQPDDDEVFAALIARHMTRGGDAGTAIETDDISAEDADRLTAYVAGALGDAEARHVEARLAASAPLRGAWRQLKTDSEEPAIARAPTAPFRWRALAVAAAVLALLGGAAWFAAHRTAPQPSGDLDSRLVARLSALATTSPTTFPTALDLAVGTHAMDTQRGGLTVYAPRGTVLATPSAIRLSTTPGATRFVVRIEEEASGRVVLNKTSPKQEMPWPVGGPTLAPGMRYLLDAQGEGPLGRERGSVMFQLATPDLIASHQAQRTALLGADRPAEDALLMAYLALKNGLRGEAGNILLAMPHGSLRQAPEAVVARREALLRALK